LNPESDQTAIRVSQVTRDFTEWIGECTIFRIVAWTVLIHSKAKLQELLPPNRDSTILDGELRSSKIYHITPRTISPWSMYNLSCLTMMRMFSYLT
jgi:hypothetical protein